MLQSLKMKLDIILINYENNMAITSQQVAEIVHQVAKVYKQHPPTESDNIYLTELVHKAINNSDKHQLAI